MPIVYIPTQLRSLTNDMEHLTVGGRTLRQVIDQLDQRFPGMKTRLCDEKGIRPGVAVTIGDEVATMGLIHPVEEDDEIHFLPAIGGGQSSKE
ncbi:MAG: MoaD/ThiS family protein [Gemmataceae bacterium]